MTDGVQGVGAFRRLSPPGRLLASAVAAADAVLAALPAVAPNRLSRELSARHLWGPAQGGPPRARPDEPLLALSFDLDYAADTAALPALLDLLADVEARASMVAIGRLVEDEPAPYARALDEGHELVNHTWSHPDNPVLDPDREFWHLDAGAMTEQVARAQDVFERILGVRPAGFRSPHFKDHPRMLPVLDGFPEIRYLSSVLTTETPGGLPYHPSRGPVAGDLSHRFSDAVPSRNSRLLQVPLTPCPEHRWTPFCSYHAIRRPRDPGRGAGLHDPDAMLALWRRMLDRARDDRFASVYFDPMDVMRDDRTRGAFRAMLAEAAETGWRLTTLDEVARTWRPLVAGAP